MKTERSSDSFSPSEGSERLLLQRAVPLLLAWFKGHKRDLPWRHGRTFYTTLVAELMLQQTRVEAVKEKYVAFLEKFPTERELALASEDEVLKAWEGLGYYTRARNLKRAAETLFERGTPRTWEGVKALAGVGDYTAGAISSIALGLKEPAVDGNVLRILTRLFADGSAADTVKKKFSDLLREVYPDETADFCEGLMELGATVCVPNGAPLCGECPWNALCRAHGSGEEERYPVRAEKRERRVEHLDVFVLKNGGAYALKKRESGLLKGLWEFPNVPSAPRTAEFWEGHGLSLLALRTAKHVFTHVEWRMTGYFAEAATRGGEFLWTTAAEIEEKYAIPSAFRAFSDWLKGD